MQRRRLVREAEPSASALDEQQSCDLADAPLHRLEPGQLTVDLGQYRGNARGVVLLREVDLGRLTELGIAIHRPWGSSAR